MNSQHLLDRDNCVTFPPKSLAATIGSSLSFFRCVKTSGRVGFGVLTRTHAHELCIQYMCFMWAFPVVYFPSRFGIVKLTRGPWSSQHFEDHPWGLHPLPGLVGVPGMGTVMEERVKKMLGGNLKCASQRMLWRRFDVSKP